MKPFDIAVIAAYLVLMAGVGFWFMRRNKDADAYFRAGGRLPWWVVSLSIYATMFSSITFMERMGTDPAKRAFYRAFRDFNPLSDIGIG